MPNLVSPEGSLGDHVTSSAGHPDVELHHVPVCRAWLPVRRVRPAGANGFARRLPGSGMFASLGWLRHCFRLPLAAIALLLMFPLCWTASAARADYAAIVIEERTGRILYEANPDLQHYPASLTKLMTLYLVFEALEAGRLTMETSIVMSHRAAGQPPSKLGIPPGGSLTVAEAIPALVVRSANDVAAAVAEHLGGSEADFATLMSDKAEALGMSNTRFRNASGLPNRRQLSTARDMATLVIALRRDFPRHFHVFSARSFSWDGRSHANHNRLLDRYEGSDGVKTGFIRASGFNLASSAEREGIRLVAIVLGARSPEARDLHMKGLLERGFETASGGHIRAYAFDRNLRVRRDDAHINMPISLTRAQGVRGQASLARFVPPFRPHALAGPAMAGGATGQAALQPQARGEDWSIQLGAFSRLAPAHLTASRAIRVLPDMLGPSRMALSTVQGENGTLYRSRLAGLSHETAAGACRILVRGGMECVVIDPEGRPVGENTAAR